MRESNKRVGNKNAEKEERVIELGWIDKTLNKSTQMYKRQGGVAGTLKYRRTQLNKICYI